RRGDAALESRHGTEGRRERGQTATQVGQHTPARRAALAFFVAEVVDEPAARRRAQSGVLGPRLREARQPTGIVPSAHERGRDERPLRRRRLPAEGERGLTAEALE